MTVYVYNGDDAGGDDDLTDADRAALERARRRAWKAYEQQNARANQHYAEESPTIDARYDPAGGGRRWAKRRAFTRKKNNG